MNIVRTTAVGLVLGFALAGTAAPSFADKPAHEPCAKQQAQYDKAAAKLAKFTAADSKAKKAQAQRVAHAQARLEKCQAAQA